MIAFHGNPVIKAAVLKNIRLDAKKSIVRHPYWFDAEKYGITALGIPAPLRHLEWSLADGLSPGNGLPPDVIDSWPERFISAIEPGADLSQVWPKFCQRFLHDEWKAKKSEMKSLSLCAMKKAIGSNIDIIERKEAKESEDRWREERRRIPISADYADRDRNSHVNADVYKVRTAAYVERADFLIELVKSAPVDRNRLVPPIVKPANLLRERMTSFLPEDWKKGRKCPECDSSAERQKCMWDAGPSCPRHDPTNYSPSPYIQKPDALCHDVAALLDKAEAVMSKACEVAENSGNWDKEPFKSWYYDMNRALAEIRGEK